MTDIRHRLVGLIPRIRRYTRSLTGNAAVADRLVEECLTRALDEGTSRPSEDEFRLWLFRLQHDVFLDMVRRSPRGMTHSEGTNPAPTDEVNRLYSAVQRLHLDQRSALMLIALEGMSYRQAAAITGGTEASVKTNVTEARAILQDLMGEEDEFDGDDPPDVPSHDLHTRA